MFGTPWQKMTGIAATARRLSVAASPFEKCECGLSCHFELRGRESVSGDHWTRVAAQYPWSLARWLADLFSSHRREDFGGREKEKRALPRTPWEEKIGELTEVLQWRRVLSWKDPRKHQEHINVLELKPRCLLARRLSRRVANHHMRHPTLFDTRVPQGASAKGRSPSPFLNRELRAYLPDILGADILLPSWWVESKRMPADGPSRAGDVPLAAKHTPP